jgi:hypothetical protein
VDLRREQILANREQAAIICAAGDPEPRWRVGDSAHLDRYHEGVQPDLVFTCPPYGDLECYSDDPRDLSTLGYDEFLESYRVVIAHAVRRLKNDRFAVIVVGDFRDKDGHMRDFPGATIAAFRDAGAHLYNAAVVTTAVGSMPIRAGRSFLRGRKLALGHQHCLCFVKGSWRGAADAVGSSVDRGISDPRGLDGALFGSGLVPGVSYAPVTDGALAAKFVVPPFTVLNARDGWWRSRKVAWTSLGIQSELGRSDGLVGGFKGAVADQKAYGKPADLKRQRLRDALSSGSGV